MQAQLDRIPAYQQPFELAVETLRSDSRKGLSQNEARLRLERHGRNELRADPPPATWRKFLAQFQGVLVLLLLTATAISADCGSPSATLPCPMKRSPSVRSCFSTPSWATSKNRGRNPPWRRCGKCQQQRRT